MRYAALILSLINHREYYSCNSLCLFFNVQFVASAKCESILNEVIYFGWPGWQKKEWMHKILWSFLVLLVTITLCIPYTLYTAFKDCFCHSCCHQGGPKYWKFFQQWFEHPYYKFVNHTTWYMAFLALLYACSFHGQNTLEGTCTGLDDIGKKYPVSFSLMSKMSH